jgi:predicted nucleic acid-binding protein
MSEARQVLVDTNILVDITEGGGEWTAWSRERVVEFHAGLIINPVIYSELCVPLESLEEAEALIAMLGLVYLEFPREALFLAARAFRQYRRRGGMKTSPLPDFFVGAHAAVLEIPLLTRDVIPYRTYFPEVRLISP